METNKPISGRGSRSEFWKFVAFYLPLKLILIVAYKEMLKEGNDYWFLCILLVLILEGFFIAFCIRRLHDIGRSGWWSLLGFVPVLGFLALIIWCGGTKGDLNANQWGENPLNKINQG